MTEMSVPFAAVPVGPERFFRAYLWENEIFAVTTSLAEPLKLSEGGLRGCLSRLDLTGVSINHLKEAASLKGKVRFLDSKQIEILLRNRLDEELAEKALTVMHDLRPDSDEAPKEREEAPKEPEEAPTEREEPEETPKDWEEAPKETLKETVSQIPMDGSFDENIRKNENAKDDKNENEKEDEDVEDDKDEGSGANEEEQDEKEADDDPEEYEDRNGKDRGEDQSLDPLPLPPPPPLIPMRFFRNRFQNLQVPKELEDGLESDATGLAARFSASTENKMRLAFKVWSEVCANRGWDATEKDVSDERILTFVYVCLHKDFSVKYGLYSFRDVYVPMLFRFFDKEGYRYSEAVKDRVKQKIASMVKNGEVSQEQIPREKGAEPITSFDLQYIASVYPIGCRDRAQIMAWCAVGLNTGARGVSMESAMWEDVTIATPVAARPDYKQITLVWRKTKGDPSWNHPVTLEGSISDYRGSNAVYWLSELVKHRLCGFFGNADEVKFDQSLIKNGTLSGQVFEAADGSPAVKSTISGRLGTVGIYCGYPAGMLSNHGLRAGFLCESLLKSAVNPKEEVRVHEVWQRCALVAGWSLNNSRNMQKYCKQAFLRCIVSSRLVQGGGNADDEVIANLVGIGCVAKNRLNPVDFHGLSELKPDWPFTTRIQLWLDSLGTCITNIITAQRPDLVGIASVRASQWISSQVYVQLAVLHGLTAEVRDSPDGFDEDVDSDEEEYSPSLPSPAKARSRVQNWIADRLDCDSGEAWLSKVLSKTVKPMVQTLALSYTYTAKGNAAPVVDKKRERIEEPARESKSVPAKRPKARAGSVKRRPWTEEETTVLCEGFIQFSHSWAAIAKLPGLEMRTNMQCKDRMRVLLGQLETTDALKAAENWLSKEAIVKN